MDREHRYLLLGMGCRAGKAVHLEDGHSIEGETILQICQNGGDKGADGLFIFDLSQDDADHERTIHTIKEIARQVDVPIITGGRVDRLEDVKKYLYAGAGAVFLDVSIDENVDLMKEASSRFGSEKIFAYLPKARYLDRVEEYIQLGASKVVLAYPLPACPDPGAQDLKTDRSACVQPIADNKLQSLDGLAIPALVMDCRGTRIGKDTAAGTADRLSASFWQAGSIQGMILDLSAADSCMELKQALKADGLPMETFESSIAWDQFKQNSDGLIPVIVQDDKTNEVLMMAYMNEEAFEKTLATGTMTYFSRSRQKLWLKGETSGHFQYVRSLSLDCDNDTILAKVRQIGAACHTGNRSCFFKTLAAKEHKEKDPLKVFEEEYAVIKDRKEHPKEGSYTNYLFDKGIDKILKKCGEEATEIIIAAKNPDPEEIKYEIADFLYHMMVLMVEKQITWEEIIKEVADR